MLKLIGLSEVRGMIREKVEIKLLDENVSEFWKQTGANE